ncbi:tRNA adenosine(34) deaminase TadA [Defluviitalea saccharophila]|uniref:tRNA-specific adenosine deaminase n=1 Tax=Defluviitalea saccharophila TaxID=879970 RepID=A0ABZ2Y520_9FIRM
MEDLDIYYMKEALILAQKAFQIDEVPIGAIITYNNQIIGRGYNQRNTKKNPLAHAEIQAIEEAAAFLGDWRLEGCTMYVTLEPCPMCAGAIVQARMDKVVFGARNPKAGCGGSILNILQEKSFNHQVEIIEGVCLEECSSILKTFFANMRLKRE